MEYSIDQLAKWPIFLSEDFEKMPQMFPDIFFFFCYFKPESIEVL